MLLVSLDSGSLGTHHFHAKISFQEKILLTSDEVEGPVEANRSDEQRVSENNGVQERTSGTHDV